MIKRTLQQLAIISCILFTTTCFAQSVEFDGVNLLNLAINPDKAEPQTTIQAKPGETINDQVVIRNLSGAEEITFNIYATDASPTNKGDIGFKLKQHNQNHLGKWTMFADDKYTLPSGSDISIPYQISIPSFATPGTYVGAIHTEIDNNTRQGDSMVIKIRKAHRVIVEVAGEKTINYELTDFSYQESDYPTFKLDFSNRGSTYLIGKGNITITGTGISEPIKIDLEKLDYLPGEDYSKTYKWQTPQLAGNFKADLNLTLYEYDLANNQKVEIGNITETASFSLMPLWLLILIAIIILLIIALIIIIKTRINKIKASYSIKPGQIIKIPKK